MDISPQPPHSCATCCGTQAALTAFVMLLNPALTRGNEYECFPTATGKTGLNGNYPEIEIVFLIDTAQYSPFDDDGIAKKDIGALTDFATEVIENFPVDARDNIKIAAISYSKDLGDIYPHQDDRCPEKSCPPGSRVFQACTDEPLCTCRGDCTKDGDVTNEDNYKKGCFNLPYTDQGHPKWQKNDCDSMNDTSPEFAEKCRLSVRTFLPGAAAAGYDCESFPTWSNDGRDYVEYLPLRKLNGKSFDDVLQKLQEVPILMGGRNVAKVFKYVHDTLFKVRSTQPAFFYVKSFLSSEA